MLSNPAKLLRAYMVKTGVYEAKQLAADLDIPIRTIQRLKLECAVAGAFADIERNANDAMDGASADQGSNATRATDAMGGATDAAKSAMDGVSPSRTHTREVNNPNNKTNNLEPSVGASPSAQPAPKGTRLSADWELPDDWRQWAEINFNADRRIVQIEADKFRDFWSAKPGKDGRKTDWLATWRNWCRNARPLPASLVQRVAPKPASKPQKSEAQREAEMQAWAEKLYAEQQREAREYAQ